MTKWHMLILLLSCSLSAREPHIPLLGTAKLGSGKLTRLQLAQGADPHIVDELGNTPLHYTVHTGSKEVTNLLLSHGADPNWQNKKGKTPLHIAIGVDNDYLVRRLLHYGALPNIQDENGNTPLHLAARNAHKLFAYKIVKELLCHSADTARTNKLNETPLAIAQTAEPKNKLLPCQEVRIARIAHQLKHPEAVLKANRPKKHMHWAKKLQQKRQGKSL